MFTPRSFGKVGVEAYAAYALRAWLAREDWISDRTRRFAKWSAIFSFVLGMAGQTSDAVKLSSCLEKFFLGGGECGGFVVVLPGGQAVPEAAEQAAEQVALGGGVPVAGVAAAVVVGAGAG